MNKFYPNQTDLFKFADSSIVRNVNEICKPLFACSDINFFYYARIFDNGQCEILTHLPNAIKYLFDQKMKITVDIPKEVLKDHFWYTIPRNELYLKPLQDYQSLFGVANLVDWIDRYEGFYEMFCFGTHFERVDLASSTFLNQKNQLESFIDHFKLTAKPLVADSKNVRISLPEEIRPSLTSLKGISEKPVYSQHKLRELVHPFGIHLMQSSKVPLPFSKREWECIHHMMRGASAKEIATRLNLSPRTVESYIENIKSKIGCNKRSEIIDYFLMN